MNFKPNKHELYLFNRERDREERKQSEREQGRERREGEKISEKRQRILKFSI